MIPALWAEYMGLGADLSLPSFIWGVGFLAASCALLISNYFDK